MPTGDTGLQVTQDEAFQRRERVAQRFATVTFLSVLGAALLGVFGNGPLSSAEKRTATGDLVLEYERFTRGFGEASLRASIRPGLRAPTVTLLVSPGYTDANEIQRISPPPTSAVLTDRGIEYQFDVDDPSERVQVEFHVKPNDIGLHQFTFAVPASNPVQFWQFTHP